LHSSLGQSILSTTVDLTSSRDSNEYTYPLNASSHKDFSWDSTAGQHEADVDPTCQMAAMPSGDMRATWGIHLAGWGSSLRLFLRTKTIPLVMN
jgi:hypothetical protein